MCVCVSQCVCDVRGVEGRRGGGEVDERESEGENKEWCTCSYRVCESEVISRPVCKVSIIHFYVLLFL